LQNLQKENGDMQKQIAVLESRAKRTSAETHDTLRRECATLATTIASLDTANTNLRNELTTVRNEEARTFELLHTSLAETKKQCEGYVVGKGRKK
jgi:ABC-type transporter Mla subunit MlaD